MKDVTKHRIQLYKPILSAYKNGEKSLTKISKESGLDIRQVKNLLNGNSVSVDTMLRVELALNLK